MTLAVTSTAMPMTQVEDMVETRVAQKISQISGVGLVRGGAGTALVGSYEHVAQRIEEYYQLGVECFVLSGFPHLEEAIHQGAELLPLLRRIGRT